MGPRSMVGANRRRAVLLTAKARDLIDVDLTASRNAGLEANRLAPDFAPAAVAAAKALFRQDDIRKGANPRSRLEGRTASRDRRSLHPCAAWRRLP